MWHTTVNYALKRFDAANIYTINQQTIRSRPPSAGKTDQNQTQTKEGGRIIRGNPKL